MKNLFFYLASLMLLGFSTALLILSGHVEMNKLILYPLVIQSWIIGGYMLHLIKPKKKDVDYFIHIPHKDL